ncbi:MAG: hypothetical protein JSV33_03620 [bacterium]|nr:MAG: hypothetical protein JSV33_03620 [bacterium]
MRIQSRYVRFRYVVLLLMIGAPLVVFNCILNPKVVAPTKPADVTTADAWIELDKRKGADDPPPCLENAAKHFQYTTFCAQADTVIDGPYGPIFRPAHEGQNRAVDIKNKKCKENNYGPKHLAGGVTFKDKTYGPDELDKFLDKIQDGDTIQPVLHVLAADCYEQEDCSTGGIVSGSNTTSSGIVIAMYNIPDIYGEDGDCTFDKKLPNGAVFVRGIMKFCRDMNTWISENHPSWSFRIRSDSMLVRVTCNLLGHHAGLYYDYARIYRDYGNKYHDDEHESKCVMNPIYTSYLTNSSTESEFESWARRLLYNTTVCEWCSDNNICDFDRFD